MDKGKQVVLGIAVGGVVLGLVLFFMHSSESASRRTSLPTTEAETELKESSEPEEIPMHREVQAPPPAVTPAPVPLATGALDTGKPQCTTDDECKGPRHAECIAIKCVQGKCSYDESHCECTSADDCDDGDPCTRNHCFSSTQKCIYIPIDDCK